MDPFAGWIEPRQTPPLPDNEVHVWGWELSGGVGDLGALAVLLSTEERARMASFRFAIDAERFLRARAGLRRVLGGYLAIAPAAIRLVYGEYGKPALAVDQGDLHFNLSHTGGIAVAAFSRSGPVGIDVEALGPVTLGMGELVFSPPEVVALKHLRSEQHEPAFFKCWTRKEAVAKAEGLGFHLPMRGFSVGISPEDAPQIVDPDNALSRNWQIADLPLEGPFAGCVAFSSDADRTLHFHCT